MDAGQERRSEQGTGRVSGPRPSAVVDTRELAREKMLADWNEQRLETAEGRTVMLTDATNAELGELNKRAQEYRDQAGELGNDRVKLADTPYALAAGDHVMFTKPLYQPGGDRVHNGTMGIVKDVTDEHTLTIDTKGAKEREVNVNTQDFQDLRLAYAQHVYKGLGLTANNGLALIGGWQTDREHAYVALTRAREQTNIYVSKEDLGTQGLDPDAIERLAEKIEQSKAQEASITRDTITTDRTTSHGLGQTNEPTTQNIPDPGPVREHGVGAAAPQDSPDPSPNMNDRENSQSSQEQHSECEPNQPPHKPQIDRDEDRGFGLNLE